MIRKRLHLLTVLRWVVAVGLTIVMLFPIYWLFNTIFSPAGTAIALSPKLYPTSVSAGVEKVQDVLHLTDFGHAYVVSFSYASVQILGILLVGSMAAFEFALFSFPGKRFLFLLALSALMVPKAVTLIPAFRIVSDLGWLNSLQGLAVPGMASAFSLFILTQYMEDIPLELLDAARIDGASHFGTYRRIVLPLSKNAMLTAGILAFVIAWGDFLWPLVVVREPNWYTVSVLVAGLSASNSYTPIDQVIGAYFLAAVPPVVVYVFLQRFIIESVTMTGIKG